MKKVTIDELVAKAILCYDNDEIVEAWNMYCRERGKEDYHVYNMSEFDEVYRDELPSKIASESKSNKFCPDLDNYFAYNEIGNLTSFNNADDNNSVIELTDLAKWLIKSNGHVENCRVIITATDIWDIFTEEYLADIYDGGIRLAIVYAKEYCEKNGIDFDTLDVFNFDFNGLMNYYAENLG